MLSVDEKLRILQPILGTRKVMGLRGMYYMKKDFRDKARIENHIDLLISTLAKKGIDEEIILPPPEADICEGDIDIGKVEYLGIQRESLGQPELVWLVFPIFRIIRNIFQIKL